MNTYTNKTQKSATQTAASNPIQKKANTTFQFDDNRPEAVVQQKIIALQHQKTKQLQGKHNSGCNCASCVSQLAAKKNTEIIQEVSKDTIQMKPCKHGNNKKTCKHCQQSIDARNVNRLNQYQTPAKGKKQQEREEAVKGKKGSIAHGFGKKGSKQSGKMKKILDDVNDQSGGKKGKKGKGKKGKKG